jgi:anti-sigma regulatory factor (Ser/Thr protein kinase)
MDRGTALSLELPRMPDAPGMARRQLVECFGAALDEDKLQTAKLLTSELVTNALLHGEGSITLLADLDQDRLLVEVIDEGEGINRPRVDRYPDRIGGYGLWIVEHESSRWGTHAGATRVWFELAR